MGKYVLLGIVEPMDNTGNSSVFHSLTSNTKTGNFRLLLLGFVVIALGVGAGYLLTNLQGGAISMSPAPGSTVSKSTLKIGAVYGSNDTNTFKDTAEGVMTAGGINGEGQYHLVRPGGDSQNVYMTSSLVDLSLFVGRKVKVWGQTQKAQSAGWLMDVGRVEVLQ